MNYTPWDPWSSIHIPLLSGYLLSPRHPVIDSTKCSSKGSDKYNTPEREVLMDAVKTLYCKQVSNTEKAEE